MKRKIQLIIGILTSLIFIYFIIKDVHAKLLLVYISRSSPIFLILGIIIFIIGYFLKAHRWLLILKPHSDDFTVKNTYPPFFIGFAANNVLPFRMGELIRVLIFSKSTNNKLSFSFSSVLLDRILDGLILFFLLGFSTFFVVFAEWVQKVLIMAAIIFVGGIACLIVLGRSREFQLKKIIKKDFRFIKKFNEEVNHIKDALKIFKKGKQLISVIIFSIAVWIFEAMMYLLYAKGMNIEISFIQAIFIMCILNFGILLPSSPGYIGTFEFFCIKSLSLFGINNELALSYAILLHAGQFIALTLLGIIYVNYQGLTWNKIIKIASKEST